VKIFRESAERSKVESNVIVYGVPESAANTATLRVNDDINTFSDYIKSMSLTVLTNLKLIRLGNNNAKKPRPLKIICVSKDEALHLVTSFTSQVRNGVPIPTGFRIVRDKTTLERELLRKAYADLEHHKQNGSMDLTVSYVNGIPSVTKLASKNRVPGSGHNHRPTHVQHLP
jgi:hypothetical protein